MYSLTYLDEYYAEFEKEQERIAIQSAIKIQKGNILIEYSLSSQALDELSEKMKQFSSATVAADLAGGLSGKAADAAKKFLENIERPALDCPIKGV